MDPDISGVWQVGDVQGPAEGGPSGNHRHHPQEEEHQGEQWGSLGRSWTELPGRHELDRTAEGLYARDVI